MFLLTILFLHYQLNTYQLQGGNRQTVQVTEQADHLQGNEGEDLYKIQGGSQEEGDNLQPAMGYETLSQNVNGIKLQPVTIKGIPLHYVEQKGITLHPANVTTIKL